MVSEYFEAAFKPVDYIYFTSLAPCLMWNFSARFGHLWATHRVYRWLLYSQIFRKITRVSLFLLDWAEGWECRVPLRYRLPLKTRDCFGFLLPDYLLGPLCILLEKWLMCLHVVFSTLIFIIYTYLHCEYLFFESLDYSNNFFFSPIHIYINQSIYKMCSHIGFEKPVLEVKVIHMTTCSYFVLCVFPARGNNCIILMVEEPQGKMELRKRKIINWVMFQNIFCYSRRKTINCIKCYT